MFSGIVEWVAKILHRDGGHFTVQNIFQEPLVLGQCIAHDGACMTITDIQDGAYSFFVMEESLSKTQLWLKKNWDLLNVERSLQFGQRVDGHMVTGHVDTTGQVVSFDVLSDGSWDLIISLSPHYRDYILPKGSIAINGVSLTVVDTYPTEQWNTLVKVCLIPYTFASTNLWWIQLWDSVNIECDMMAKYIVTTVKNIQS